jgi:hypothetical protein
MNPIQSGVVGLRMAILKGIQPTRHDAAHARAEALPADAQSCGARDVAGCTVASPRGRGRLQD